MDRLTPPHWFNLLHSPLMLNTHWCRHYAALPYVDQWEGNIVRRYAIHHTYVHPAGRRLQPLTVPAGSAVTSDLSRVTVSPSRRFSSRRRSNAAACLADWRPGPDRSDKHTPTSNTMSRPMHICTMHSRKLTDVKTFDRRSYVDHSIWLCTLYSRSNKYLSRTSDCTRRRELSKPLGRCSL